MSTVTEFYSTGHRKHYTTLSYELPNYINNWEVFVVKYTSQIINHLQTVADLSNQHVSVDILLRLPCYVLGVHVGVPPPQVTSAIIKNHCNVSTLNQSSNLFNIQLQVNLFGQYQTSILLLHRMMDLFNYARTYIY